MTGLAQILERYWGYTSFRPLQQEAMAAVLAGRDSLLVLPTGGGKSICFQAPALLKDGLAVVISPLISLMKDQVDTLVGNGVPAACFHSALTFDDKSRVSAGIRDGRFRLLYVAPERLVGDGSESFASLVGRRPVSFVAVDEAHCISQWGHDFRPEYRQLALLRERWPGVSLHAYTATATERVRRDIVSQLGLRDALQLVGSFDRPNLVYRVLARSVLKKQLQDILARHAGQSGIIYCQSRREVDALAAWLVQSGVRAVAYHAGLEDDTRHRHQDAFLNEDIDVVVATVAFGMGIDRSDVRFVVHAGAPQSLEHYQQEAGRAGRDGLEAECVLIYSGGDFARWRAMLEQNGEWTDARRTLLRDMERYAASVGCRHRRLIGYFGETYTSDDCGACDYCLGELEAVPEPATVARKILSAVARVGQRFGANHVTNILRGSESDAVTQRGHQGLSVFGLLRDATVDEVRGYIDQLVAGDLLRQTDDQYPVLKLTAAGVALMKDAGAAPDLSLARQKKPEKGKPQKRSGAEAASWEGVDRELFEALRALRLDIAHERRVPPYVIFHDTTLRELARLKPSTPAELRHVYGIGAKKADDLGAQILDAIQRAGARRAAS
ncbi:MAG TPA: DNA helicase RecQ [Vicinamibacterales bacterium]|nr:DNA helicase RecQ [Vicinamibacterales bacterium]